MYLLCTKQRDANIYQQRLGSTYWDTKASYGNVPQNLPENLRIKPGGLTPAQLHVYEEFGMYISFKWPSALLTFGQASHPLKVVSLDQP